MTRRVALIDSGLGGLTVFSALRSLDGGVEVAYFADTAHVPYGDQPLDAVARYGYAMIEELLSGAPAAIVVASGTTCAAFDVVGWPRVPVPVVGVAVPGARAAAAASKGGAIGIVATQATADSGLFQRLILQRRPEACVTAIGAPALVPLVESGAWASDAARDAVEAACAPLRAAGCDTVVLGCTHFPHLRAWFERSLGRGVAVVDPATACAADVHEILAGLAPGAARLSFAVSGDASDFAARARALSGVVADSLSHVELRV